MAQDSVEVGPGDVTFLEELKESECSVVFKVLFRGTTSVMKVWPGFVPTDADPKDETVDPFLCESTASRRLKTTGFCERREIPDFYGTITNIDLDLWPELNKYPTLRPFCEISGNEAPPNAILIEYIPDCESISLSNFSPQFVLELRRILTEMHKVEVLHHDPWPRNMMISKEQNRIFWMDFDRAQTYDGNISEWQKTWFKTENDLVDQFIEFLTKDYAEGKLKRAYSYYYSWFIPDDQGYCWPGDISENDSLSTPEDFPQAYSLSDNSLSGDSAQTYTQQEDSRNGDTRQENTQNKDGWWNIEVHPSAPSSWSEYTQGKDNRQEVMASE
ncbi:uncharacterized protein N7469_011235 [Penicillium citrinum]|uniref:Aminoglycoside phosphotransferase domain-containing protein n=1 Tax=Penicillium citrinum TaxID=5077 RepID=A0A9W9TDK6_PENCI|nr:uncharacterized protein N7469_011235 [Penicillium citrinum]KAJ5217610.1 hypothetical protein N7469_011235 [Penicillium citrinum]